MDRVIVTFSFRYGRWHVMFPGGHGYILNRAKHDISKNALMFEIGRACGTEDIKFEDVVIICHKCGKQTIHPVKMDYCINPNCV